MAWPDPLSGKKISGFAPKNNLRAGARTNLQAAPHRHEELAMAMAMALALATSSRTKFPSVRCLRTRGGHARASRARAAPREEKEEETPFSIIRRCRPSKRTVGVREEDEDDVVAALRVCLRFLSTVFSNRHILTSSSL
jgi:hypothetical protein